MRGMRIEATQRFIALARSLAAEGATPDTVMEQLLLALDADIRGVLDQYKTEGGVEPACRRGCWRCCTVPVVVVLLEAVHIAAWLERSGRFTKGLGKRLRAVSEQRWGKRRARCAFLRDRECAVYLVRPVRCRGHYGIDAKVCHANYLYGHEVARDVERVGGTDILAQGMWDAMMAVVEERKSLLLEDAMLAVGDAGGAERAWQRLREPSEVFGREWPCVTLEEYVSRVEVLGPTAKTLGRDCGEL